MAIVRTNFVHSLPVLEDDLQTVLLFPVAPTTEGNVDSSIAILAPGDERLVAKLYLLPHVGRGRDRLVLVFLRPPRFNAVLIVLEDMSLYFLEN